MKVIKSDTGFKIISVKNRKVSRGNRGFIQKATACLVAVILTSCSFVIPVLSEGASAKVSLALSRPILNIGKTFLLTLKVTPDGANFPITAFNATIQYDTAKFELIKEGSSPKITKPSGTPANFKMEATDAGNKITTFCADDTLSQNAPIQTKGETSLISFTFKVKDNAAIGTASFLILDDCSLTQLENSKAISVPVTIISPKTAPVAARLETNTNLSEIKTDIGVLSPGFSKTIKTYSVEVPMEKTAILVTAKLESSLSKMVISGGQALAYGINKVTITVTAQDPEVVAVYTINVKRPSPYQSSSEESSVVSEEELPLESSLAESSEEPLEDISSFVSSSEPSVDTTQPSLRFWQLMAYLFIGLFLVTAGVLVWFIIDKFGDRGNMVKVRRLK